MKLLNFKKPSELNKNRPPVFCRHYVPIMQSAVSMIYAGGGIGKSYLAIRMAVEYHLETRKKVVLWLTEDAEGENRFRFESIVNQEYPQHKKTLDIGINFISTKPIRFTKLDKGNAVLSKDFWGLRSELFDFDLVVIDPLLQFNGCDENSNTHAGVLMGALKEWSDEEQKSIVLIHHASKSKEGGMRPRGAGEWSNGCRSVFSVEKIGDQAGLVDMTSNNLKISLVKDNGLSYFFRDEITGVLEKTLRVFPDYKREETQKQSKLFLSVANHNDVKNPDGFSRVDLDSFYEIHIFVMAGKAYSQYEFTDGYRKGVNNLGGITIICLDYDNGLTLEKARKKFSRYQNLIITTRSHQKEKSGKKCDRFRVILPLETPLDIPINDYPFFLDMLNKKTGGDVDPSTKDLARFYFSSPKNAVFYYSESNKLFDWHDIYNEVRRERVRDKIKKEIAKAEPTRKLHTGKPQNVLPENTLFETNRGTMTFSSARSFLSVGAQIICRCHEGINHGDMGDRHYPAFIKKAENGNVFYSCSGGRCQHIGSLWCDNWEN